MANFEPDAYIERLIALRENNPLAFAILHPEVQRLIREYEQEKEEAGNGSIPSPNQKEVCAK